MSLDQNLFTLTVVPRESEPHVVELVDPHQVVHYRKERKDGIPYDFSVFDPLTGSLLAIVTAPSPTSKHKTVQLYNPSVPIELKSTGLFTFRWNFTWEEHEFEWKKEECFIIRKPDPPVLIALTKEPSNKTKTRAVQILDYNIKRFDVLDRKGLEIVILSSLLSFLDYFDAKNAPAQASSKALPVSKSPIPSSSTPELPIPGASNSTKVISAPRRTGLERIAELQGGKINEIEVTEECDADNYGEYCSNLLENDNINYVVLRAATAVDIPKVLQTAQHTKRRRLEAGDRNELLQYIHYDNANLHNEANRDQPSSRGFIVRLCKAEPTTLPRSREVRHNVVPPSSVQVAGTRDKNIALSKSITETAERVLPKADIDVKGKGKVSKRSEKERRRGEKEEELVRKKREVEEAEERRRKEAEELKKKKTKPPRESKAETNERKRRDKEAEEERRKQALREVEEKKERERREKKEKSKGKGKATQKPPPEPPVAEVRLDVGRFLRKRTVTTTQPAARPVKAAEPSDKSHAQRHSARNASSSRPRSPSFDTGVNPAHALRHLRNTSTTGTAERPYVSMQRPITMYGTYSGSSARPVLFPAESMPVA